MKNLKTACVLGIVGSLLLCLIAAKAKTAVDSVPHAPAAEEDGLSIYFNPDGGAEVAIVQHINAARRSVFVQSFHFTSPILANALIAARQRGVDVRIIIDHKAFLEPACLAVELHQHDIPVLVDAEHHTAHNKIMIFDESDVLTGSYNYTPLSANDNAENALFITGKPKITAAFVANFHEHLGHSLSFEKAAAIAATQPSAKAAKADD
jgi:phosphatidylserine/phosphatidylglycerophosphate/cardiolipin synthase-like enzyme